MSVNIHHNIRESSTYVCINRDQIRRLTFQKKKIFDWNWLEVVFSKKVISRLSFLKEKRGEDHSFLSSLSFSQPFWWFCSLSLPLSFRRDICQGMDNGFHKGTQIFRFFLLCECVFEWTRILFLMRYQRPCKVDVNMPKQDTRRQVM